MPQLRTHTAKILASGNSPYINKKPREQTKKASKRVKQTFIAKDDDVEAIKDYPLTPKERINYRNSKTNRIITEFQFKVYDLCAQIPRGQISTYKAISDALHSHPRAVGQALRVNPFAPNPVPCHRVISSDLTIGGFDGGFGDCQFVADKKAKLAREGCVFNEYYEFQSNAHGKREIFTDFKV